MTDFRQELNRIIEEIGCSNKELAERSGLSIPVISRYRSGDRTPSYGSIQMEKLLDGISAIADEKAIDGYTKEELNIIFEANQKLEKESKKIFSRNFNQLLQMLEINISHMADKIHYDPSFISRIRTGKRVPSDVNEFADSICLYLSRYYNEDKYWIQLAELTGMEVDVFKADIRHHLKNWLQCGTVLKENSVMGFLKKLDSFDLNNYIRAIHFDELKVPTVPFQLPASRHYYGLVQMRTGEIDFLKATVMSKRKDDLYLCSDMPVDDMAEDEEFAKKYMFGLAMVLKKGLHIHIVHNVERPMKEMMLGLENWVPLYMTGQVSPYYIKGVHNQIYNHLHYASGACAMTGECVNGQHSGAHYYLTNNKEEVAWYRKNLKDLIAKASPLMKIFREESKEALILFLEEDSSVEGARRRELNAPPIFALSEEFLQKVMQENEIQEQQKKQILDYCSNHKKRMECILTRGKVEDEMTLLTEEEFKENPVNLSIAGSYPEKNLVLTYDEYLEGIRMAQQKMAETDHYYFHVNSTPGFRNIDITMHCGKWVLIAKNNSPGIHFLIHHPKLVDAFENLVLFVTE